jgi:hypothetical protein
MTLLLRGFRFVGPGAAALLALALLPALAGAETLHFRNDTPMPIVMQGACVVQGKVQRDRPQPLRPTEACRIALPGNKLITIYDPSMPNRILFQATIPAGPEDLYFSVRQDPLQGKVIIERVKPPNR